MKIFISRVPPKTNRKELERFIDQGLNTGIRKLPLFTCASVNRCEVVRILDESTGLSEIHGIADIDSEKPAGYVVEKLTGKRLCGKPVAVHEYRRRSPGKERRNLAGDHQARSDSDRREADRRRPELKSKSQVNFKTQAVSGFHKVHN